MNFSSKVPPRFVPTLTEVIDVQAQEESSTKDSALDEALADVERTLASSPEPNVEVPLSEAAPLKSFHSPWRADGLYARSIPASIPQDLPPLPESLPPQQPFAVSELQTDASSVAEVSQVSESIEEAQDSVAEATALTESTLLPQLDGVAQEKNSQAEVSTEDDVVGEVQASKVDEDVLLQRLMQRVDQVLAQRLQETMTQVLEEQTRGLAARLREELESVVRQAVTEAVTDELSAAKSASLGETREG